jgi:predicted nucleotidyltransferase
MSLSKELLFVPNIGTIVLNMSTNKPEAPRLSNLFGKTRKSILALLFSHPDESFYARQIFRLAGIAPGAGQRELTWLSASGIIQRSVSGNQVYYQANPECPIFQELKSIITKTFGIGDVLRTFLAPLANRIKVGILYGSMVDGRETKASDIDLLVVGNVTFAEVAEKLTPAQDLLKREINPTVFSVSEFQKKLIDGHHFLSSVLKSNFHYVLGDEIELKRMAEKRMVD